MFSFGLSWAAAMAARNPAAPPPMSRTSWEKASIDSPACSLRKQLHEPEILRGGSFEAQCSVKLTTQIQLLRVIFRVDGCQTEFRFFILCARRARSLVRVAALTVHQRFGSGTKHVVRAYRGLGQPRPAAPNRSCTRAGTRQAPVLRSLSAELWKVVRTLESVKTLFVAF
jgi:hypothetical protein